jgi:protein TonB
VKGFDLQLRSYVIILSVLLHGAALWFIADRTLGVGSPVEKKSNTTRVSLSFQRPVPVPPEPVPKPKPKPKPKPEPKPKPKPKPKPEPKPEPPPKPIEPEVVQPQEDPGKALMAADAERMRQTYLSQIIQRVEAKKHYPRMARRRGLEGTAEISFVVDASGRIQSLRVNCKQKILRSAALKAVERAAPFPMPPNPPFTAKFNMLFELND